MIDPLPPAGQPSEPSARLARTVLIIDDEPQIRRAVQNALAQTVERVLEAATGTEGIDLAAAEQPDLVILDLGLPDRAGLDVCREIRSWMRMPIIVLSARHSEQEKVRLFDAGADDYVTKPFGIRELEARVRAQLRRMSQHPASDVCADVRAAGTHIDFVRRNVTRDGVAVHLTPIEWKIVRALASAMGRVLTHQQLFDAVWGLAFGDPQLYLRVHITHIRRKLEVDPTNPMLIVTEPGVGYRMAVDE